MRRTPSDGLRIQRRVDRKPDARESRVFHLGRVARRALRQGCPRRSELMPKGSQRRSLFENRRESLAEHAYVLRAQRFGAVRSFTRERGVRRDDDDGNVVQVLQPQHVFKAGGVAAIDVNDHGIRRLERRIIPRIRALGGENHLLATQHRSDFPPDLGVGLVNEDGA